MTIFKPYFQHYEQMPFIFGKNIDYIFLKKTSMYLLRNGLKINFIHGCLKNGRNICEAEVHN